MKRIIKRISKYLNNVLFTKIRKWRIKEGKEEQVMDEGQVKEGSLTPDTSYPLNGISRFVFFPAFLVASVIIFVFEVLKQVRIHPAVAATTIVCITIIVVSAEVMHTESLLWLKFVGVAAAAALGGAKLRKWIT